MECHHKRAKKDGGGDEYKNLVWVFSDVHKLIHTTSKNTIDIYRKKTLIDIKSYGWLTSLRELVGNFKILI